MTAQRIKRLRAIGKIRNQSMYPRIIQPRLINVKNLVAIAQQLLDYTAAHYA
jgi:hypothetical protein